MFAVHFENKNYKNLNMQKFVPFDRTLMRAKCSFEVVTMSLVRYVAKVSKHSQLPDPKGALSASVSPATIKEANKAVMSESSEKKRWRGSYAKFSPEQQAAIGKYASLNGNQAAICHFFKQLEVELKVTSVHKWKTKYLAELSRKRKAGETNDLTIYSLPVNKHGRPLLLGQNLDSQVKLYIQTLREGGGMVTTSVAMAAFTAIVRKADRNLLAENGGGITITNKWAESLPYNI